MTYFGMAQRVMLMFYHAFIESIYLYGIAAWFDNLTNTRTVWCAWQWRWMVWMTTIPFGPYSTQFFWIWQGKWLWTHLTCSIQNLSYSHVGDVSALQGLDIYATRTPLSLWPQNCVCLVTQLHTFPSPGQVEDIWSDLNWSDECRSVSVLWPCATLSMRCLWSAPKHSSM